MSDNKEMVNHPDHYRGENGIEAIDAIRAAIGDAETLSFCQGNALKYLLRAKKKGKFLEDLQKAKWYIEYASNLYTIVKSKTSNQNSTDNHVYFE